MSFFRVYLITGSLELNLNVPEKIVVFQCQHQAQNTANILIQNTKAPSSSAAKTLSSSLGKQANTIM